MSTVPATYTPEATLAQRFPNAEAPIHAPVKPNRPTVTAAYARMSDDELLRQIDDLRAEIRAIHDAGSVAAGPQTARLARRYAEADRRGLSTD